MLLSSGKNLPPNASPLASGGTPAKSSPSATEHTPSLRIMRKIKAHQANTAARDRGLLEYTRLTKLMTVALRLLPLLLAKDPCTSSGWWKDA